MRKYSDTIIDLQGNVVSGASVTVYLAGTTTKASLYSANDITKPIANPLSTDSTGSVEFYADNNRYDLVISGAGLTATTKRDILLFDPAGFTAGPFVQEGTTYSRDIIAKLKDVVVTVTDFGAVGNGSADDTTAIQSALNAAGNSNTRKVVYFPMGEYKCTAALTVPTNVSLIGAEGRVYHLYYDNNAPRMPVLRFTSDTDGVIFSSQFFKDQIKNLGIYSGLAAGTSTKIGLRLSTNNAALTASTTYEGLSNVYENVEVNGFKLGCKISGAYSWNQFFDKCTFHNCETDVDIECQSAHHMRFNNCYFNCDSGIAWVHANRRAIVLRAGGRVILSNCYSENMGVCYELAAPTYSDLATTADSRQLYVDNLYAESFLQHVFKLSVPGYVKVRNMTARFSFYDAINAVLRLEFAVAPTEKSFVDIDELQVVGLASPSNRRIRKLFSSTANGAPSSYQVVMTNVEVYRNDFEVLWDPNYPPNKLTFKDRDNAGNLVEVYQASTQTSRAYAVLENEKGNVPANSLKWTNAYGNILDLNTLTNQLVTTNPIRRKQDRNQLPVWYDNTNAHNGRTFDANLYSGIRYVNFGGNLAAFSCTVDMSALNLGDEFFITDTSGTTGATATVTIGAQTFTVASGQFIVIRKIVNSGAGTATEYRVVARGTA